MTPIGLVIRPGNPEILDCAREVIEWANAGNRPLLLEEISAPLLGWSDGGVSPSELVRRANPIVSLGGDGTLLGLGRYVRGESPILIGVNFGHLGFLTEISPNEVISVLERALEREVKVARRSMILAEVRRGEQVVFTSQAVNDAVILKGTADRLLDLDLWVDSEYVVRFRGDGIIVATPTGSTAYSLAAGGSIVHPTLSVALVTPVCAHSLTSRPLILPLDSAIEVRVPPYDGEVFLSIDGQLSFGLRQGDVIELTRSPYTVTFVRSPRKSYFEILRSKLNWGIANKSDE